MSITRQRLSNWIKKKRSVPSVFYLLKKPHIKYKDIYRLKVNGERDIMLKLIKRKQEQLFNFFGASEDIWDKEQHY